jgi:phage N-6-adenine-methyltransferase
MNDVLFSSKSIMWETSKDFFDSLNALYSFTTDVCAIKSNTKCKHFFSPLINGLKQPWEGRCWMNPPYGRNHTNKWVEKAFNESRKGCLVVALLPVRTDTRWFHDFIYNKPDVTIQFIKGRLKFSNSRNAAPFPSMVVVFGKDLFRKGK